MRGLPRGLMAALVTVPLVTVAVVAGAPAALAQDNGVGQTPALGWSSWSFIRHNPTAANIEATADAMKASGLYTKPGAQEFINSWANQFASWGVDYVKIDGVGTSDVPDIQAWSTALRQTGRPIHLELSNNNAGAHINAVTPANGTIPDTVPVWLKLVKNGSTFTGYYSTDGTTWSFVGSANVPGQADTQDAGMFVTSHATGSPARAMFDGFNVSTGVRVWRNVSRMTFISVDTGRR
jgi:hypothetical protein